MMQYPDAGAQYPTGHRNINESRVRQEEVISMFLSVGPQLQQLEGIGHAIIVACSHLERQKRLFSNYYSY
jgi:hypothetical protein